MRIIVVFIACFLFLKTYAQDISSISLQAIDGKSVSLSEIKRNKATVIIFLLADCPACENYALTLNKMNEKYRANGIAFYGVFPGNYSKLQEIMAYKSTYKINFPLLLDKEKKLVKAMKAKVSPQAFVINSEGKILYNGRIDDWMYAVGKKRTIITHHELQDALDAIIKGSKITAAVTAPVGCIIE